MLGTSPNCQWYRPGKALDRKTYEDHAAHVVGGGCYNISLLFVSVFVGR